VPGNDGVGDGGAAEVPGLAGLTELPGLAESPGFAGLFELAGLPVLEALLPLHDAKSDRHMSAQRTITNTLLLFFI